MIRFAKKAAMVAAAGILATSVLTGCSGAVNGDAVVATVGEEEISLGVANFFARLTQGQYETYYAGMMGTTPKEMWSQEYEEGKNMEESTKEGLMETLEEMYIVSQHTQDYGVSLTDEEKASIEETAKKFDEQNSKEGKSAVSGQKEYVEKYLELITIAQKMETEMKKGVDEVVSDEDAAQKGMQYVLFSYKTTDESGNSTDLSDEEKESRKSAATEFASKVKKGGDFESLAKEAGAEVQKATFDSESTSPNADLVAAVDALAKAGESTDLIETDAGVYVGKLTSLLDREATDAKKESIVEQRRQDQYDSLLDEWKKATEINVNKKVWAKISFKDQGVTIISTKEEESGDNQ